MSDRTTTLIIWLVAVIWAINFIAGLFHFRGYETDQAINGIFMAVVGGLFAMKAQRNRGSGDG